MKYLKIIHTKTNSNKRSSPLQGQLALALQLKTKHTHVLQSCFQHTHTYNTWGALEHEGKRESCLPNFTKHSIVTHVPSSSKSSLPWEDLEERESCISNFTKHSMVTHVPSSSKSSLPWEDLEERERMRRIPHLTLDPLRSAQPKLSLRHFPPP
jgi:hypothetical protein